MELPRRRPEPAAIDITWVSCRGVKSSLPFHRPCLYASIFVVSSSSAATNHRRHHRVKTPIDRAGGENPEWDAPLRLYLPGASPSPAPEAAAGKITKDDDVSSEELVDGGSILLVKFELKSEVAVLGDVHTASAAVHVPDLIADGRTRRVSYQLLGPDGRQPNGVLSFSYAFHERSGDDVEGQSTSTCSSEPATPTSCCPTTPDAAAPRLYPAIEWALLTEQPAVYPPLTTTAKHFTVADDTRCYPPAPPPSVYPPAAPPVVEPASVYPPVLSELSSSSRSVYPNPNLPKVVEPASKLYPTVDLAPVSYYPPAATLYSTGFGHAAPGWGDRCLYG